MNSDAAFIDQIVQNVMREIESRAVRSAAVSAVSACHAETGAASATVVQISAKVVTADVLVEANAAGQKIALPEGAVLTPSGRDFIRRNSVAVTASGSRSATGFTPGTFIVIGNNSMYQSAASAAGWTLSKAGTEVEAAHFAAQGLTKGRVAVCGGEPSIVACLLNRNPDMRAAVISKATNVQTLTTLMSPQVVCLDSSGWSFGEILKLLRTLLTASRPQGWKEMQRTRV